MPAAAEVFGLGENARCNHLDPSAWRHSDGRAFCRGCGRFMGYMKTARQNELTGAGVAPETLRQQQLQELQSNGTDTDGND